MCEQKSHISARECERAGELPRSRGAPVPRSQLGSRVPRTAGPAKERAPGEGAGGEDAAVHNCSEGLIILISEQAEFEMEMRRRFPCHSTQQLQQTLL